MKLVRGAAVLAGIADVGYGALFLFGPDAFHPEMEPLIYARWVGFALLGSAATLFIVVADPRRYLPVLYVNIAARALATLLTLFYITQFKLFIAIVPSHTFLVAALVAALVFEMKLAHGPKKAAGAKPAPRKKPAPGKSGSG